MKCPFCNHMEDKVPGKNGKINIVPGFETYLGNFRVIKRMLKEQDAVLVSHYYVHPDLQDLAEATGGIVSDSLDMATYPVA